jgi:glycosyltransferase involved in cell wall biosynthesis
MAALVSVVIPTHNRAGLLGRAIDSCLRQGGGWFDTSEAIEVIVVDDNSTDETGEVLEAFGDAIVAIRNTTNLERGASRNVGARLARGRWLAFLDSDDEWEDDKLASQLEGVGSDLACLTGVWLINEEGAVIGLDHHVLDPPSSEVDVRNPFRAVSSSLLIDRALFNEVGGFPEERDVQGSEDWLLMAKLVHGGVEPAVLPAPLVRVRVHEANSTASPDAIVRSGLAAIDWLERSGITMRKRACVARGWQYETGARGHAMLGNFGMTVRYLRLATQVGPDGPIAVTCRTVSAALRSLVRGARLHSIKAR